MRSLMTEDQMREFLCVKPLALYRLRRQGMPCIRLGYKLIRYDLDAVLEWLQSEKEEVKHG